MDTHTNTREPSRHLLILYVPHHAILDMLRAGASGLPQYFCLPDLGKCRGWRHGNLCAITIPVDVKVDDIVVSWERKCWGILLEHPSFDPVPMGELIPSCYLESIKVRRLEVDSPRPDRTVLMAEDPVVVKKQLARNNALPDVLHDPLPEPFASYGNLDMLRRTAWESDRAKQILRNAGFGWTGLGLVGTVEEFLALNAPSPNATVEDSR